MLSSVHTINANTISQLQLTPIRIPAMRAIVKLGFIVEHDPRSPRALCEATGISPSTAYRLRCRPDFGALVRAALEASTAVAEPVPELVPEPVVERGDRSPVELATAALEAALPNGEADPAQERQRPAPPNLQKTIAEAAEQPLSSRRYVDGVPLWGDSDGWPFTTQDHAERDAYYTDRRDLSETDRIDYNTVVLFRRQPPAEKRAAHQEQLRSRHP